MDLTKTTFRLSLTLPLALLVVLYPSAHANAGAKIYQSVDSNGHVTFTDVPVLLGTQVTRSSIGTARAAASVASPQPKDTHCSPLESGSKRYCAQNNWRRNNTSPAPTNE